MHTTMTPQIDISQIQSAVYTISKYYNMYSAKENGSHVPLQLICFPPEYFELSRGRMPVLSCAAVDLWFLDKQM